MNSTEYTILVNKYNELVDKHNALSDNYDSLADKHNKLCDCVNTMATMVTVLLVDYIEKIPDEKAKETATKLKGILISGLDKVLQAE